MPTSASTNLFPAFEGPDGQQLHVKGRECTCHPFMKITTDPDGSTLIRYAHRPLVPDAPRPSWLPTANDTEWSVAFPQNIEHDGVTMHITHVFGVDRLCDDCNTPIYSDGKYFYKCECTEHNALADDETPVEWQD